MKNIFGHREFIRRLHPEVRFYFSPGVGAAATATLTATATLAGPVAPGAGPGKK